ncbi:exopolysaccharide biosynthesis polyprenyl glycosylphosphotransferase [Falsiroseomonas oryziterrae]|uniref:exopolysaccharide biosynthesis polyprenyl glycosylphosphotransferase n=1 Tax=Falsiroseomonas oryziterrae TaxID=2911368 RepID=UPI001F01AF4E|nr:exopolysaccharide biosynthesis polyprenyl glycosylphosphotransferase [Roseomonas sp. NPKOSM-4]
MSGQATLQTKSDLSDLRALLADPASAARPGRIRVTQTTIRIGVAIADAAMLVGLAILSRHFFPGVAKTFSTSEVAGLGLLVAALAVPVRYALRLALAPDPEPAGSAALRAVAAITVALAEIGALGWLVLPATAPLWHDMPNWLLAWGACAAIAAAALRFSVGWLADDVLRGHGVVVVGTAEASEPIARAVAEEEARGWRLAGRLDDRDPGAIGHLLRLIDHGGVDMVVLSISGPDAAARIDAVRDRVADRRIRVCQALDADSFARLPPGLSPLGRYALLDLLNDPQGGLDGALKRATDIGIAGTLLLLLSPLLLLVALAIRLESPGPVLFRQWRFGLCNRPIRVIKFRTMRSDACDPTGEQRTQARDARVTAVGRFLRRTSIDELPQLLNVLRGDMSLVGPRPHPLHMRVGDAYYFEAVGRYRVRHLVKPGLTGWAQVNGSRGEVDTLEKALRRVELDLWYVRNWSPVLDLRILVLTAMGRFITWDAD